MLNKMSVPFVRFLSYDISKLLVVFVGHLLHLDRSRASSFDSLN